MNNVLEVLVESCCTLVHPDTDNRRRGARIADAGVAVGDSQVTRKVWLATVVCVAGVCRSTYPKSNQFSRLLQIRHVIADLLDAC